MGGWGDKGEVRCGRLGRCRIFLVLTFLVV